MSTITQIHARQILDSRGNPTLEVDVRLKSGANGRFGVPSGASTGEHEACELRDADAKKYLGKGVLCAVANVREVLAPQLLGDWNQEALDQRLKQLDGTAQKSRLGANALLGVSMAFAHACAQEQGVGLFRFLGGDEAVVMPVPLMNVLNGGQHADNNLDIQEFMIVPYGAPSFSEALRYGTEIFHHLKAILKSKGLATSVGDEGGFAPSLPSDEHALELLESAIVKAGFRLKEDVGIALDVAASGLFDPSTKRYNLGVHRGLDATGMVELFGRLSRQFAICSIEDALDENDWEGFAWLTKELGGKVQIVGDDLFVTNPALLERGIKQSVANAILIKPNQIGTLSETVQTIRLAQKAQYGVILSHRSGETEDTTIADLAVAFRAGQIKTGSLSRSDRVAKYNQLLRIEENLAQRAVFLGRKTYQMLGW